MQKSKKCGIMHAVKKKTRCAFTLAAATIGVLASSLRSGAVLMQVRGAPLSRKAAWRPPMRRVARGLTYRQISARGLTFTINASGKLISDQVTNPQRLCRLNVE